MILFTPPKNYYEKLNKSQLTPLWEQIKISNPKTDFKTIFKNLHENPFTDNRQKQITYRLLFNITPTSQGIFKRTGVIQKCKICNKHMETEQHIFYFCPLLSKTKSTLKALSKVPNYTNREFYRNILLATTRKTREKDIRHYRLTIVQLYRDTCWEARVGATYKQQTYTSDSLHQFFMSKVKKFIMNNIDIELLERLDGIG